MYIGGIQKAFFYFSIFMVGAAILIIQIVGTRLMAPIYGSTVYVWSSLITATLAALAVGYYAGGKLADKKPNIGLFFLLFLSAGILLVLVPFYSNYVLLLTYSFGLKYGPLVASSVLFMPPLLILGMVSPYAVKLATENLSELGFRAGSLYALSTSGSLFGGLLAGFYLFVRYPVYGILNTLGISLILIYLIWKLILVLQK